MMTWGALDADGNIVRDPTFPDMPTFKEVCEATKGCETSGDAWDAWKAFFIAGFPAQKDGLPAQGRTRRGDRDYTKAFNDVMARSDFRETVGQAARHLSADDRRAGEGNAEAWHRSVAEGQGLCAELAERALRRRV